jgi:hypothetical protein
MVESLECHGATLDALADIDGEDWDGTHRHIFFNICLCPGPRSKRKRRIMGIDWVPFLVSHFQVGSLFFSVPMIINEDVYNCTTV